MNTRVFENEISSGSYKTSHDTSSKDDVDTMHPECVSPGLKSIIISPKKRKLCEDFSTSIINHMDGEIKR